jgi:glycosyltransferase Alg8
MSLALYVLALAALAAQAPIALWRPDTARFLLVLCLVGAWHYGWETAHLVRALIYRHRVFPKWRRAAEEIGARGLASEVYVVITTYRNRSETTARVYQAAIAEAARYGRPVTLVAALVELGDQRLIKRLFQLAHPPLPVRLTFVRRPAIGKRHALATALRAIGRARPAADAAVVVLDGDTLMPPGCLARCLPFLKWRPDADGITTDETALVEGSAVPRAWLDLRSAARHQLMSSLGLARRPLAVAGRMAIYRADVATDPDFIAAIECDELDHWRFGRIRFATGADQSIWSWLLRGGRAMLYLPDVRVIAIGRPASWRLLPAASRAMRRRFGDRLRTNARALALGPRRLGWFAWWCALDQRVSMWSMLAGPIAALLFGLGKSLIFLYLYLLWIGATGMMRALLLLMVRPRISGLHPLLIIVGRIHGAVLKTFVLFRLEREAWRLRDPAAERSPWRERLAVVGSMYLHLLALGVLIAAVALVTNLVSLQPRAGAPF